ncbi:VOC family protein [Enterococcus timonensis]|uniref:VOC family protein n=1 Tax=Enterococcus timonensis TaxID=1852364 RepID=UPI0008D8E263|nr:VOC family protein [Enterococcus timonensis]
MNRINLICLGVEDLAKSLQFYKALGFKTLEENQQPPIVFFNNQGTKLELFPLPNLAKDINEINPPARTKGFPGITLAINLHSTKEVDEFFDLVQKSGGTIIKLPTKNPLWDGYSGYFTDLDGYYWEVAYGSSWKFDENNMLIID